MVSSATSTSSNNLGDSFVLRPSTVQLDFDTKPSRTRNEVNVNVDVDDLDDTDVEESRPLQVYPSTTS